MDQRNHGMISRIITWWMNKLCLSDLQWPTGVNSIRITSKISMLNFAFFFCIYIIGTYVFWPKYFDQFQNAEVYSELYDECSSLKINRIIQLPSDFYKSILISCNIKNQSKLSEFCNISNSTISIAINEIYEKYYYNFAHYKNYQDNNATNLFSIEWRNRDSQHISLDILNNKMIISGDVIVLNQESKSRSTILKDLIEMCLLSTGILESDRQLAVDYLPSRKLSIDVKIPFSHFPIKDDIRKLFMNEIEHISSKLPYFIYINLSKGTNLLDSVRDQLMKEIPNDHLSLSVYLTDNTINEFNFIETNDRKYGIVINLKELDSSKVQELISFFELRILNIIPNSYLYIKANQANVKLHIDQKYLGHEFDNFKKREINSKRYIMLYQLAATGWAKDRFLTSEILDKAENKSLKSLSEIYNYMQEKNYCAKEDKSNLIELPIDKDLYGQMEFPYVFQFALFFTFYIPLTLRFTITLINWIKTKVKKRRD